jgi:hypothetical protein
MTPTPLAPTCTELLGIGPIRPHPPTELRGSSSVRGAAARLPYHYQSDAPSPRRKDKGLVSRLLGSLTGFTPDGQYPCLRVTLERTALNDSESLSPISRGATSLLRTDLVVAALCRKV